MREFPPALVSQSLVNSERVFGEIEGAVKAEYKPGFWLLCVVG